MITDAEKLHNINLKCKNDPIYAGRLWGPNYFTNKPAPFQYDMIQRIKNRPKDVDIIVIECMRGAAKTTLLSSLLSVHDGVYDDLKFTVIASHSEELAQRIVGDAKNFIRSDRFSTMFPNAKIIKDRKMLIEVCDDSETGGFEFQIMSRGRTSQTTGLRFKENRINRFIGDDLEDPEAVYSQELVDNNFRYINEVVIPAMAPGGLVILIGTPFAHDCTTRRFSDQPKGVMTLRYPLFVDDSIGGAYRGVSPTGIPLRMGKSMSETLGIEEGRSIWEDRFPTDEWQRRKEDAYVNGNATFGAFLRQRMLDPRPPGSIQFNMEGIKYVDLNELKKKLNVFILCDFAYSRQAWADDSAIVVVGLDNDGNYYVLYAAKDKWGDIGTADKIFQVAQRFKDNLRLVGVETRSYGFVKNRLIEGKRKENINFGMVELKPGNRSKPERIKALIPLIEDGRLYMARGLRQLTDEMSRFRGEEMRHGDDLMDALAYILDVSYKPDVIKTQEQIDGDENKRIWAGIWREQDEADKARREMNTPWRVHDSTRSVDNYF